MNVTLQKFLLFVFFLQIEVLAYSQTPIIHLPFDGNANDISGNGINGTTNNVVLTTDRLGNANSAYEFNGSSSSIMLPYDSKYNFASNGQFTISVWLLPYNANSIAAIVAKSPFNSNFFLSLWNYGLYLVNNKGMSGYANNNFLVGSTTLSANACWHHLAITYNNGVWVLYVNGVIEAQDYSQTNFITQSTAPIGIGKKGAANGDFFNGKLDDLRIYNTALTYAQIKSNMANAGNDLTLCAGSSIQMAASGLGVASWSPSVGLSNPNILNPIANPSVSTQYILTLTQGTCVFRDTVLITVENCCFNCLANPINLKTGLVACYDFNGNANDGSGYNNHGIIVGAIPSNDRFGRSNKAYNFNGSGYIYAPNSISLSSPAVNDQITISLWVKISSWVFQNGVDYASVISKSNSAIDCAYRLSLTPNGSSVINNNKLWSNASGSMLNQLNTWDYYTITTNVGITKLFKNGVLIASNTNNSTFTFNNDNDLQIGRDLPGFLDYFYGDLDDIRIYNRALSNAEVLQLYQYTSTLVPAVNAGTDISLCFSDSFQLAGSGNGQLTWEPTAPLAAPALGNTKGKVNVNTNFILTNTFGSCIVRDTVLVSQNSVVANAGPDRQICKREIITINGSGSGTSYSWLPIKNISNNLSATPKVNPDTTTTYILTVSAGNCLAKDTVTIFVNPLDATILTNDTSFCIGDTITLRGTTNNANYTWSPSTNLLNGNTLNPKVFPNTSMWYYLTTSDAICTIKDSVLLSLKTIQVNAGTDTSMCEGDTIQLIGSAPIGSSINWMPINLVQTNTNLITKIFPTSSTTFILEAKQGNCIAFDSVYVALNAKPIVSAGNNKRYCFGLGDTLNGTVSNAASFNWIPSTGLNDPNGLNPLVFAKGKTMYYLTGKNGACTASDSVWAIENPPVNAAFSANPLVAIAPAEIRFTNASSNAYFFEWNFGENNAKSYLMNTKYKFVNTGRFEVWLIASDSLGCLDSASLEVELTDVPYLHVPNAFTPNGDGKNDFFTIVYNSQAFAYLNYQVYNRWGDQIYETEIPSGNWWNGTYKGNACSAGVYFYTLKANTLSGKEYNLNGTLTLMR